jgi:hypothetical protein
MRRIILGTHDPQNFVRDTSFRDTSTMRRIILETHDPQNIFRDTLVEDTSSWQHAQERVGLAYSHPHQNADLIQTQVTGVLVSVSDIGEKFKGVSVTVPPRETRGGGGLLKLRLLGTQRVQMTGLLPWLVRWACRAGTRDFCSALAALVGSVQNIFSHPRMLFHFLCLHRQANKKQAAVLDRLVLSMSLSGPNRICSGLARQRMLCFFTSVYNILWKRRKVYSANSFIVSFRRGEGLQYQQFTVYWLGGKNC